MAHPLQDAVNQRATRAAKLALRQKSLDIACLERPAGVLFHLAGQRSEILDIDIGAPHGYHAIDLAIAVKGGAAAATVRDVVNGGDAEVAFHVRVFDDETLRRDLQRSNAPHLPAHYVKMVIRLCIAVGKQERTPQTRNGIKCHVIARVVVGGQLLRYPLVELQWVIIAAVAHIADGWVSEHMTGCHQIVIYAESSTGKRPLVAWLP